jgi:hypothetical protein
MTMIRTFLAMVVIVAGALYLFSYKPRERALELGVMTCLRVGCDPVIAAERYNDWLTLQPVETYSIEPAKKDTRI